MNIARNDRELFLRAFSFVLDPKRLLQDGFMRDPPLDPDEPLGPERACSAGWLMHCGAQQYGEMIQLFDREAVARGTDPNEGIGGFNDTHTHAEVVALWRAVGVKNGWLTEGDELPRAA